MKIINYLLLSLFIIAQVSCSNDDDARSFDVTGEWTLTEGYVEPGSMTIDLGGMPVSIQYSGAFVDIDQNNWLKFHEDHTFTSFTGNMSLELNMIIMGQSQTQSIELEDVMGDGTWEVNGNELKILNSNGTSIKYHIDNLNGDTLELSANVKDMSVESGSNPILDGMDMIVKMKLKRI